MRAWSSFVALSDGSPAFEVASVFMILAAVKPGGPSVTLLPSTIVPPADCTSELNQTTTPSYCAPWISMKLALGSRDACRMRPSHVLAGLGTRSLRYQSSCVFVLAGAAHSR